MAATTPAAVGLSALYDRDDSRLPTNSRHIRILHISASSSTNEGEQIQGDLRVVDLEASPPFSALSYVWGVDDCDSPIIKCGDFDVPVTVNCYSALLHLRKKLGNFSIWIDTVCINQANTVEKELQIPLMEAIYASASTVYVWLGEGTPQSDRGPSLMLRILHYLRIRKISRADYITSDDVNNILEREWIRRVWTYQEIMLASNPVIVCGDRHLQWTTFAMGIVALQSNVTDTGDRQVLISLIRIWVSIVVHRASLLDSHSNSLYNSTLWQRQSRNGQLATLQKYDDFLRWIQIIQFLYVGNTLLFSYLPPFISFIVGSSFSVYANIVSFGWILLWTLFGFPQYSASQIALRARYHHQSQRISEIKYGLVDGVLSRKAQDPKDKAFALWAVLQRSITETLPAPDYSLPVGEVYKQLSVYMIQATGSLDMLLPAAQSNLPGQPSWVPDWSQDSRVFWRSPSTLGLYLPLKREMIHGLFFTTTHTANMTGCLLKPHTHTALNLTHGQHLLWEFDSENLDTLSIQASSFQTISSCYLFKKTSDVYLQCETAVHLQNLQKMLDIFRKPAVMCLAELEISLFMTDGQNLWTDVSRSAHRLTYSGGIGTKNVRAGDKLLLVPGPGRHLQ
ncbi:hypothetical protein BP6252_13919 [Coleophoma cylindrospora]|uniref:Heterokaryon incompatibility domain-containing protein n=1 Tax=Coleophoma cylindrospora TaxID=1849047 RepID=A0A3D8Q5A5_9HELO|nr:hypothetical protein BP6252_13919 [Coleophoma cylindrospora]